MTLVNLFTGDGLLEKLGADVMLVHDVETNPLYFQKVLVEDNDMISAIGLSRVTSEFTILFEASASALARQRAICLLLKEQVPAAKKLGINQVHVWTDIRPETMLHYGFTERKERSYILHF